MFADHIDLVDRGAAAQQRIGRVLHCLERDRLSRQCEQRRATARNHTDHQVLSSGLHEQFDDRPRRLDAGLVGHGVARLANTHRAGGRRMAVAHGDTTLHRDSTVDNLFHGGGHRR